ncbi:hypothetical protein HYU40_02685 [Candidatus Woesearchaeota archaeon]|nr:hypothetical protein [Candidatus Woesearchaeota archaeon]
MAIGIRAAAAETMFWLHFVMVAMWFGLFLVPASLWAGKISFHFWFILIAVAMQFGWGAVLMPVTKKYRMVCPLTTAMQLLRGYPVADARNNNHSCIKEFFHRIGKPVPKKAVTISTFVSLGIVTLQYFFFR